MEAPVPNREWHKSGFIYMIHLCAWILKDLIKYDNEIIIVASVFELSST